MTRCSMNSGTWWVHLTCSRSCQTQRWRIAPFGTRPPRYGWSVVMQRCWRAMNSMLKSEHSRRCVRPNSTAKQHVNQCPILGGAAVARNVRLWVTPDMRGASSRAHFGHLERVQACPVADDRSSSGSSQKSFQLGRSRNRLAAFAVDFPSAQVIVTGAAKVAVEGAVKGYDLH